MPNTTNSWKFNADGDWATAADWGLGTIPDSNNDVVINTVSIHTITHNSGNDTVHSLTVGNDHFVMNGGTLAFVAGASFSLDYQQNGGMLLGAGTVSIANNGSLLGGGADGTLAFSIGGTIAIANYTLGGATTLTNNATTNETANITLGDVTGVNATITNSSSGTYTINGDYGLTQGAASAKFVNAGALQKAAGSNTSVIGVTTVDTGTISVASGTLQFNGPSSTFKGTISGAGRFALGGGGTDVINAGTTITTSGFNITDNGTTVTLGEDLAYAHSFSQGFGSTLNLNGHALALSGPASFFNAGFGTPTVNGSGSLSTSGATMLNLFVLGGTVTWNNSGTATEIAETQIGDASGATAIFNNQAAGTFDIVADTGIAHGSAATSKFDNAGAFAKTGGSGTSFIDLNFVDTGTIAVSGGTLEFRGPTNSFSGAISGAGQFALGGAGANTIAAGTTITTNSIAVVDNGTTVTLGGNLIYSGSFAQSFATAINLNGKALTLSGPASFANAGFGTPTVNGSGVLSTSGATSIDIFTLGGTVTWNDTGVVTQVGQLQVGDAGAGSAALNIQAAGKYNIANDTGISHGSSSTSKVNNAGTFAKTAGNGTSFVDVDFASTGTISIASGTMEFRGANDTFGGAVSGLGQFALGGAGVDVISAGATITASSFAITDNGTVVSLAGNLSYSGSFSQGFATSFNLNGKTLTLSGPASFFNAGFGTPMVNGSGTMITSGTTSVSGFVLGGSVVWNNSGVVNQVNTNQIGDAGSLGATFSNQSSGHYNITDDTGVAVGAASTSKFLNAGAFAKVAGTGKSVVTVAFTNTGSVEVASGTLDFANSVSGAGTMKIDAGATLEFAGSVATGSAISFAAATGRLQIDNLAAFSGAVAGFVAGDVIDLANQAVASMKYNGATLTVTLTNNVVETLKLSSSATALRAISDGAGGTDIIATSSPFALTSGNDIAAFVSGANIVTGTASTLTAGDALSGGTGVDTLALSGGGSFNLASLAAFSFDNVTTAAGANYTIAAGNVDVASGQTLTINAFALGSANSLNFNASTAMLGTFRIIGGKGVDTLVGGGVNDIFNGEGGNDTMTGGSGTNTFLFNTQLNASTNDPTITNFGVSSDNVDLAHQVFTALLAGPLPAADFTIGTHATTASQHIIYNSGTGALLYDSDGSGSAAAVQFAKLSTGLALTAANFTVI